jgi:hypothetical protein
MRMGRGGASRRRQTCGPSARPWLGHEPYPSGKRSARSSAVDPGVARCGRAIDGQHDPCLHRHVRPPSWARGRGRARLAGRARPHRRRVASNELESTAPIRTCSLLAVFCHQDADYERRSSRFAGLSLAVFWGPVGSQCRQVPRLGGPCEVLESEVPPRSARPVRPMLRARAPRSAKGKVGGSRQSPS